MPRIKKPVYLFLKEELTETEYLELLRTDGRPCITIMTMGMLPAEEKDDAEAGIYTQDNGRTFQIILEVKKITPKVLENVIRDLSENTKKQWIVRGVYDFSVSHSPRNQRKG